jgi:predicted peptidase
MSQKKCSLRQRITKNIRCNYLLFLPASYHQSKKKWPLILFLHGSGERGDDLNLVKKHGLAKIVDQDPDFPFIVVSPQCPKDQWWSTESLATLLDSLERKYRIDKRRICVTGLSLGGYATWQLAIEYPKRFAAIAPICGGSNPHLAGKIKHLPVWVFHGAKDEAVPIEESRKMVSALRKVGAHVKLTVYPKAGHDSWTQTYENKRLYDWFLSQRQGDS